MTQVAKATNPGRITIRRGRIRFSEGLFTASSPPNTTAPPAHNVKIILEPNHPQLKEILAKINAAAVATFKGRAQQVLAQAEAAGKVCLRPGNLMTAKDGTVYAGFEGNYVLSARNPARPMVLNAQAQPTDRAGAGIYDGCYVDVQVDIFGYTKGSNGVSARLLVVQKVGDGEPLGGGMPATVEDFGEQESSVQAGAEFSNSLFGTSAA